MEFVSKPSKENPSTFEAPALGVGIPTINDTETSHFRTVSPTRSTGEKTVRASPQGLLVS